jgi:hypothetical protein
VPDRNSNAIYYHADHPIYMTYLHKVEKAIPFVPPKRPKTIISKAQNISTNGCAIVLRRFGRGIMALL